MTHINVGDRAKDSISGFSGIVIARTEWLNKCIRITIAPEAMDSGKMIDNQTFDEEQVVCIKPAAHKSPKSAQTGGPSIKPTRNADPR